MDARACSQPIAALCPPPPYRADAPSPHPPPPTQTRLGNGTSVLIFAGIASSLPASVGALLAQNASEDPGNIGVYAAAFFLTTLGIIYVQEAERRIPINYSRFRGRGGRGGVCVGWRAPSSWESLLGRAAGTG
jgi:hypothetical protein